MGVHRGELRRPPVVRRLRQQHEIRADTGRGTQKARQRPRVGAVQLHRKAGRHRAPQQMPYERGLAQPLAGPAAAQPAVRGAPYLAGPGACPSQ